MRLFLLACLVAAPAAAQTPNLGKRTAPPEQSLAGIGGGSSDAALASAEAAAARFPLGTLQNPVRVGGPEGERAYVARLRCADGKAPRMGIPRPGGADGYGSVADLVPLDCGAAAPGRTEIAVDLYFEEHREERAPDGFALAPR
ncbi:MAG: hypothetical protein JO013_01245 [Alphaproteobacteria bacterium]|nr:hypothetical protein [Alphaproteobacteria bacterium]